MNPSRLVAEITLIERIYMVLKGRIKRQDILKGLMNSLYSPQGIVIHLTRYVDHALATLLPVAVP